MATTATSPGRRSDAAVLWAALLGVAALCWAWLLTWSSAPAMSMSAPMGGSGAPAALLPFLGLWVAMMAAMMLPSVAPVARLYLRVVSARTAGLARAARVTALLAGYFLAWAAYGLVAFGLTRWLDAVTMTSGRARVVAASAALAIAGTYQFSPLKARCLAHCRSPLGVLMHVGSFTGRLRDGRVGAWHGGYCLGCCWSLMLVLVAVGVMNMVWMAALAIVILLEKVWRRGPQLSLGVGVALLVLAVTVPWQPGLIGA
ncbi:MAG TPA: DUF2182 domain-containing protein [Oryzihumus sp.]|nr:DUF2182 domain-containing protein [Oryzihumus sp.]